MIEYKLFIYCFVLYFFFSFLEQGHPSKINLVSFFYSCYNYWIKIIYNTGSIHRFHTVLFLASASIRLTSSSFLLDNILVLVLHNWFLSGQFTYRLNIYSTSSLFFTVAFFSNDWKKLFLTKRQKFIIYIYKEGWKRVAQFSKIIRMELAQLRKII